MRNEALRKEIREIGAHIWEVAECLGVSEMTVQRRLRKDLSEYDMEVFREAAREASALKLARGEMRQ